MSNDSLQIKELKRRYKLSLNEKANTVLDCKNLIMSASEGQLPAHLEYCRAELHKLAGSSGMYGYKEIFDLSRGAMRLIKEGDIASLDISLSQLQKTLIRYYES